MSQSNRPDLERIIHKKPHWIIRWGISILWGLLLLLGAGYYFVKG